MAVDPVKIAIKGTTQDHLPIEDVVDGIVILKDGSCAAVLKVSSVNFDLLSEREQQALIYAYGGILNSLTFPIQIVIHSSTKDVSSYLERLRVAEEKQDSPQLKERIQSYRKFIEDTVKRNDVLSKSFYIVIPFSVLALGMGGAPKKMFGFLPKRNTGLPYSKEYILEKARANLEPKRDHLVRLFARLGLEIKEMNTKELLGLFYKLYNPEGAINQNVQNFDYGAAVVSGKK